MQNWYYASIILISSTHENESIQSRQDEKKKSQDNMFNSKVYTIFYLGINGLKKNSLDFPTIWIALTPFLNVITRENSKLNLALV